MKNRILLQFLLLLIAVFSFSNSYADPVDSLRALNYAKQFYGANNTAMKNGRAADFEFTIETKILYNADGAKNGRVAATNEFLYYVFNVGENNGFVIISGDDAALPVLGYSTTGRFDSKNLNPALAYWMNSYKEQLKYIKDNNLKPTTEIQQKWENVNGGKNARVATVGPLIQTTWDQSPYYNTLCPVDGPLNGNARSVTGCTATSIAQVLRYWNFPTSSKGTGSYTLPRQNTEEVNVSIDNSFYDWSNMPVSLSSSSNSQQVNAVAKLMYNCGVSIKSMYGSTRNGGIGTGAYPSDIPNALIENFSYKPSAEIIYNHPNTYTTTEWENKIKTELDALRPVIYGGYYDGNNPNSNNDDGGHSFICDGYNNIGFHMNWGWGGVQNDAYWQLSALNTGSAGTGSGQGTYNLRQNAIIGIEPNINSTNCPVFFPKTEATFSSTGSWYVDYIKYATKKGLIGSNNGTFDRSKIVKLSDAARSIVLIGLLLNKEGFRYIYSMQCPNSNLKPNATFIELLRLKGLITQIEADNSESNISFGRLCKLFDQAIFGPDFPKEYRSTNFTNIRVATNAAEKPSIFSIINIKGIVQTSDFRRKVEYVASGFKDAIITGNENVQNVLFAKMIANVFSFVYEKTKGPATAPPYEISSPFRGSDNPDDYIAIGDKYENTSTPYGSQVPQYTLNPISMVSGQTRTFSFPDVTIGGLPVHVYWAVDGALGNQGSKLVPVSNTFQSVIFTAPTVTTSRTIQLYYYAATDGGYMAEFFQDIVVSPAVTPSGSISISPSASSFNFGSVTVGQSSSQTFTIQNTSSQNVTIDNYVLSGSGFVPLVGTTCCGVTLAPNQTTSIAVGFTPSQAGAAQGTLEINGGFTGSPTRIVLSGTGLANTAPTISTIPTLGSSVSFINTKVGNYEDKIFTISNNSQSNFTGSFSVSGSAYTAYILNESGTTLNIPAGGTKYVYVRFSPTDNTTFSGSFTITGNASNTPSTFSLSGLGYGGPNYGCVSVNTRLITKGVNMAQPGTTEFGRFTLTNTSSTKSANIINFKLVGWDRTKFTISPNYVNSTFTLSPSQSQEFIVYLTNSSTQANYDGGISIQGDGCDYTDVTFRGVPATSSVNAPELYAPANNFIMSYPGGYTGSFFLQMKKKNTGDLAKYLLYLFDETSGQILYNFVDYGTFSSTGPDQFFTIRNTSSDNIYAQLGHRYSWKVRAVNTANVDDYKDSPIWYFTVEQPPLCLPPTGIVISNVLSSTAQLDFVKYTYAQNNNIQISSNNGGTWSYIGSNNTGSAFSIPSLTAGTTYQIRVQSFCGQGAVQNNQYTYSSYGTPVNFTTQALCQATISPSSTQSICFGQTATLSASSGSSYQWYKDDILIQGATSQTYQVSAAGAYSVKVSKSDGCSSTSSKTTVNVIYTNAQVNVSGSTQICGSNTVILSSSTTGLTYQWLKDNVNISGATNNSYTANQAGSYSLKITNQGCIANSQNIEITPLVVSAPTIAPQTINSGQTTSLTASGCSGTVKWYNQQTGGTLLFTGNPYTTSALTTTTTYYASCTVNNCESSRGNGTVTVNCAPPAAPTVNSVTITSGQTASLTASGCSGTVKWYNQQTGGTLLFTGNPYTTSALTTTTTYYASCTVNNCESSRGSGTVTVNSVTQSIAISSPISGTFSAGQSVSVVYASANGSANVSLELVSCTGTTALAVIADGVVASGTRSYILPSSLATGQYRIKSYVTGTTGQPFYGTCFTANAVSNPCPPTIVHGIGVLAAGTYKAAQTVTSQANISTPTTYQAGNSILLSAGFQAGPNESFIAQIGGCTTSTVPTNGLIAYYPFTGNANDASGNGNNATNSGATLITDRKGVANSAYYFNGTNAWLNTPMVQANLTGYTISAWVKPEFTANQEYVVLQNRGTTPGSGRSLTLHYQYSTGRWGFAVDGDGIYTGKQAPSPNTTNWVHVVGVWSSGGAGTFNASQFTIYVNGVLLSASSLNGNTANIPNTGAGTVAIGRHQAWNSYFKGAMDDIRVYNRALTDAEVQNIYVIER